MKKKKKSLETDVVTGDVSRERESISENDR